uniref:Uncharacterized protein n=1 Tax=Setaria digitata TaxID=48799 RepID=A0A915PSQ7_9BILA
MREKKDSVVFERNHRPRKSVRHAETRNGRDSCMATVQLSESGTECSSLGVEWSRTKEQVMERRDTPGLLLTDESQMERVFLTREETMDASNELSGCEVLGYGIGHFYNDLCASMWFTYLLLFLEKVVVMRSSVAGLIMLIGQATDALSTAFIGVLSDSTPVPFCFRRCGQRKSWHALGTVLVTFSFAFVYNKCFMCNHSPTDWELFAWYAPYVVVFQIGWAAVQISHLALIPELASDEGRRMTLNSVRHGCTVVANLIIYAVLSVLLHFDDSGSAIGPVDLHHFSRIAGMVIVLGLFTETFFYTVTKEPLRIADTTVAMQSRYRLEILLSFRSSFLKWIYRLQFYKVILYSRDSEDPIWI